jgi:hypothetical protein
MIKSMHFRIRLACLILIGGAVNLAGPTAAHAAPATMCTMCADFCPSDLVSFCGACANAPVCAQDQCGAASFTVYCSPI